MPLVPRTISNLFGGVSQQPAGIRLDNQCEELINAYPSLADGLVKRPPSELVAVLVFGIFEGGFAEGSFAARAAFQGFAPSEIAALGSGAALVVGIAAPGAPGGTTYLIYKPPAITALKDWIADHYNSSGNTPPSNPGIGTSGRTQQLHGTGNWYYSIQYATTGVCWLESGPIGTPNQNTVAGPGSFDAMLAAMGTYIDGGWSIPLPTIPTIFDPFFVANPLVIPAGGLFGTPGATTAVQGGASIAFTVVMTEAEAAAMITTLGGTEII